MSKRSDVASLESYLRTLRVEAAPNEPRIPLPILSIFFIEYMSLINHNQDNTEALSNDSPVITFKIRSYEFKFGIFTFMKNDL